jgi:SAM-dependent methyltransferase
MIEKFLVPIYVPKFVHRGILGVKRLFVPQSEENILNLLGDRDIEWSFVSSRLPTGPGDVLDFGCGFGNLSIHAIQKGHRVVAVDLEANAFPWFHPNVEILQGDLIKLELPKSFFDFVLNCSTIEHVGLAGRYGIASEETDADLVAMQKLRALVKPSGKMLMTIPCGQDASIVPWHRVYGETRLPKLLEGFLIEEQSYWTKQSDNRWHPADRKKALSYVPKSHPTKPLVCMYALGCFVLRPIG